MTYAVQFRRGTTAEHASFTGAAGEVTVNTTTNQLIVHDGTTVGGHVIGTSNGSSGGASTLTDLNITDGTSGQVLTTDGAGTFTFATLSSGGGGSADLSTIISPAAFAYVNTTSDGSGTNISWANWNASSGSMDFTFTTSQSDTNYAVISDVEGYDDTNIMVTSKTTTGFTISIYDDNGNVASPSSTGAFSIIVYSSVPTLSGTTSSEGSSDIEIFADMTALIAKTGMTTGNQAYVSSNNKLYMYTGTGWYLIATVQNDAPSAITNVDDQYKLTIDGTPTLITATATDPEGFPLTWSYAITSGSLGSTATISQTDNVFTITPSTNTADAGEFTLTISATDGANGAVNKVTSIILAFKVTNSRYTTLLATAVDTYDNNNITDSSTNNHSITVTGDPDAGTFSPYRSGGYSTYFYGSGGNYVKTDTHSDFAFSTEDFTIECWYYPVSKAQNFPRIWHFGTFWQNNQALAFLDRHNDNPTTFSLSAYLLGDILNSTTTVENNNWYHLVVERSGATITLYVNGVSEDTYDIGTSEFITSTSSYVNIGNVSNGGNLTESELNGYIRDFRYVKGTAVYDGNFTPPTKPLEEVTNTKLLTCHLPYIADGSTNAHAITMTGNVPTQPLSPYDYGEYDPTVHGGSVYFAQPENLSIASDPAFGFGTGDFTIEFWTYWGGTLGTIGGGTIVDLRSAVAAESTTVYLNSSGVISFYDGPANAEVSSGVNITKEWTHISLTRNSGVWRIFINGTLAVSRTSNSDLGSTKPARIGQGANGPGSAYNGYISDFRIVKGTAVYTSNFTPPTAPQSSSGASLHIKGTDASIIDKSQGDNLKLIGNITGSTTVAKFTGSKSMYFDEASYIRVEDLGSGPLATSEGFTIEGWIYPLTWVSGGRALFGLNKKSDGSNLLVLVGESGGKLYHTDGSPSISTDVLENEWSHIAVVVVGILVKIYLNGSEVLSVNSSGLSTINWNHCILAIGGEFDSPNGGGIGNRLDGYIQDFRITKGLARYTANFTPPTEPLKG
jgi:hypothetical protein